MFPSHPNSPLSFSGLLLVICLRCLAQPVKSAAISFNSTLNAVSNSTALNHALGINCRGSSLCPTQDLSLDYIDFLLLLVNGRTTCEPDSTFDCGPLNDTDIYKPYAHIACLPQGKSFLGGICAFTQGNLNPYGTSGATIKLKLKQLSDHGCQTCGSVPLSDDNDPAVAGILTVNYISGVACPGVCPPTHYYAAGGLVETY